ncbi:uncharacterized protein LOC129573402 [Sitodiplosis mosellana]|uniref:uncharacterized protein LOC129573402 n=1 Tax=Sitodiplosis mosellana TaxID=263140 RepID=UPI00244482D2|nr:uncharacterized protein LOC129573402 [Sitodiplosis mosellana]
MDRLSACLNWKVVGVTVGYIGIAINVGLATFFVALFLLIDGEVFLIFTLFIFFLNLLASIVWLRGIFKKKKNLMRVSLIWWGFILTIWGGFMLFVILEGIFGMVDGRQPFLFHDYLIFALTAFCLAVYFIAIWSYEPIKESFKRNQPEAERFDVELSLATRSVNKDENRLVQRCGCGPNCDCCKA